MHGEALAPHPTLLVDTVFDDEHLRRACLRGDLVRVVAGRYVRRKHWERFDARERYAMLSLAAHSRLRGPVVLSHASAAALWGFPRLGPWPDVAHVIDSSLERSRKSRYVSQHRGSVPLEQVLEAHGVLVTSPVRTAVDLALSAPFRQAVTALDHGLRSGLFTKDDLHRVLADLPSDHARKKASKAIEFADARANRPGESLSRVLMHEGGLVAPVLQKRFEGPQGQSAEVDAFFEEVGAVGEFDGMTKYRDSGRWSGLPPEEVVVQEKLREDWLRRHPEVRAFVRWTWADLRVPGRLVRLLRDAGVPLESARFHGKRAS
ncbi:hypothetical protein [Frondihabitans cladoniiphilus]|uniref:Transcriptional regulator, AbiEi antitoxin, Type IV TA system n=1 Tax=Frondihabitans cladoniiphilus TaxID=715785 RepID=A0ABP8VL23_9MICO